MGSKAAGNKVKKRGEAVAQDVAIVGIGCRFPQADHYNDYWNNMINHVNSVTKIGFDRWQNGKYGLKNEAELGWDNEQFVKYCASLSDIDKFDNTFFNLSPREVTSMDPQQRILLEETWHCIEDSGIPLRELREEGTSVYVGVTGNDYNLIALTNGEHVDHYAGLGNFECIAANRISHYLGLTGESLSLDTACSSSLVAVHKARQNLQIGDSKYALAAGVCLAYHPWRYITFSKSNMMSRDGQCKAFDAHANGFVQGEGAGVLLLQRLDDAIRDGNHIYGVIKGTAVNHCGESQTIAAPSMKAQMDVVDKALQQAGVNASTVNYIEAHGTGTALGDPIEVEALTNVFRQYTDERQFCTIGSVKTNIGHLASAAGVAGIIRVLMMMKHKKIPKLLNLSGLNPLLDWENTPFKVADQNEDWRPVNEHTPLRAGVSGFGFGGVNAHVIIESYDRMAAKASKKPAKDGHIFALSALNGSSLSKSVESWKNYLNSTEIRDEHIGDMCRTLLVGRRQCQEFRLGAMVQNKKELLHFLESVPTVEKRTDTERKTWDLHFCNILYQGYSDIKPFMEDPYIQKRFERIGTEIELTGGHTNVRNGIRVAKWNKERIAAYSFIANYVLAEALISLGIGISSISGENQGTLIAMAVCSMIKPADAYSVLTGEKTFAQCQIKRPLLPFIEPIHKEKIRRYNIGKAYIEGLRDLNINETDSKAFKHYVEKARTLNETQYTFKKYLRDWDQALRLGSLTAESLLHQDELLTGSRPELNKRRLLLLLIAYGSLLKLNQKWDLSEQIQLSNERLHEFTRLVLDEVITKEMAVELLMSEKVKIEDIQEQANERQGYLNSDTEYPHLNKANNLLVEIEDITEWTERLQSQLGEHQILQTHALSVWEGDTEAAAVSIFNEGMSSFNDMLIRLWTAGADMDWALLYPKAAYNKLPLPGYVFDKASYWMPLRQPAGGNANVMQTHPMLDMGKSSPERQLFVRTLKVSDFYVGDHIVDGQVILPGVAYLEMARAAGEMVAGQNIQSIKDVLWVNRMQIEDSIDAFIQIYREPNYMNFQVYTVQDGNQLIHCKGKLYAEAETPLERRKFDIGGIKQRCGVRITKDFCYNQVFKDSIGFQYGPSFQATTEAFCGDHESLEKLDLPADLHDTFHHYDLHPSIVDAALRAVTWIGGPEAYKQLRLHIPFALGEVVIYGKLTPGCYSYARIAPETIGKASGMKRFQVYILNELGEVLVEAKDFTIRQIQPKNALETVKNLNLYTESWLEAPLLDNGKSEVKNILFFGSDRTGVKRFAEAIARQQAALQNIIFVGKGTAFKEIHPSEYIINPAQEQDYCRLLEELKDKHIIIDSILYDWELVSSEAVGFNGDEQPSIMNGFYPFLHLFKAFTLIQKKDQVRFLLAAANNNFLSEAGLLKGLSKAFQAINRNFIPSVIYYNSTDEMPELAAKELLCRTNTSYSEISYQGGTRNRQTIAPLESLPEGQYSGFRNHGTYLITGGMGRLGMAVAEFIVKRYEAKVVLTGRSELDETKRNELERLQAYQGKVIYVQGDISDRLVIERIVKHTKETFHSINGVIHCAGVLGDQPLLTANHEQMIEVLLPKIHGAIGLDIATQDEGLDFFVLFSSISSIIGDFARGTYAAANSFLDRFATDRAEWVKAGKRTGASISVNWPIWNGGGMQLSEEEAVQYHSQAGLEQLDMQAGLELLDQLVKTDLSRIVVACGERQQVNRVLEAAYPEKKEQVQISPGISGTIDMERAVQQYLKEVIAKATGIPVQQVDVTAEFSKYGIDSIMIMDLNSILEKDFSDLPSTLFFEYNTIEQMTAFFITNYGDFFQKLAGVEDSQQPIAGAGPIHLPSSEEKSVSAAATVTIWELPAETKRDDIAIIGLSGQYPMADTLDEFWEVLRKGQDCVTEIPKDRWDYNKDFHPEKGKKNKVYTKWGAFMNDVEKFDAGFFHISPREAELMDPQERLMLQSTYHTLEDAGYVGNKISGKQVGVFVGVMNSHYQMLGAEQYAKGQLMDVRSSFASIANRISYHFNFKGPSIAIDTMCSSALVAIHMACESIRHGESELAVAGSVNTIVHPAKYIFLADQRFGSTEGKCRAFGQGGDGYVPGEGVGAVLLKPLELALRDGDHIYGLIKGTAVNHGGKVSSYTVPNPNAQSDLIEEALKRSGIHPETINYIEAHGTGTALGDPIEVAGLTKAFRKFTANTQFCAIGSVKSNVGHLESAAGMASLTKVLLQMKHKQLAPSILAEQLNENIDFEKTPFYVQRSLQPWEQTFEPTPSGRRYHPLRAGISSFGAGGTNAHIIIEDFEQSVISACHDKEQLIILSAKSRDKLKEQAGRLASFIARHRKGQAAKLLNSNARSEESPEVTEGMCVQVVAEVLGMNPDLIDWDEDLTSLCADAVHRINIAGRLKELYQIDIAETAFFESRSLRELMTRYEAAKETQKEVAVASESGYALRLEDIAYTLQVGREAFDERVAIISKDIGELEKVLVRFSSGEPNVPDVYTGSLNNHRDMTAILFHNESGHQFIQNIVRSRQLQQIAQLWLLKVDIGWEQLHEGTTPQIISMPNYIFDKKTYWIGKGSTETTVDQPESKPVPAPVFPTVIADTKRSSVVTAAHTDHETTVEHCLIDTLTEVIYTDASDINTSLSFSEYGVNSVLTLEFIAKVNEKLGIGLHPNDLFNFNNIKQLSGHILARFRTELVSPFGRIENDGWQAEALEPVPSMNIGQIDLNELEFLLEDS
ncbi:SDR family NAD(P)-dependent oxidoreductase [Paenibacillus sp. BR2-3]